MVQVELVVQSISGKSQWAARGIEVVPNPRIIYRAMLSEEMVDEIKEDGSIVVTPQGLRQLDTILRVAYLDEQNDGSY